MIVIVDHVTLKEEGTKETVVRTAEGTEHDIEKLLRFGLRISLLRLLITLQYS